MILEMFSHFKCYFITIPSLLPISFLGLRMKHLIGLGVLANQSFVQTEVNVSSSHMTALSTCGLDKE